MIRKHIDAAAALLCGDAVTLGPPRRRDYAGDRDTVLCADCQHLIHVDDELNGTCPHCMRDVHHQDIAHEEEKDAHFQPEEPENDENLA